MMKKDQMEIFDNIAVVQNHIGLAGGIGSGKTTVCNLLSGFGFTIISLSDFITEEIKVSGKKNGSREIYFETANYMRKTYGNDILAQKAIEIISKERIYHFAIDGLRIPEELNLLKRVFIDFLLIGISTPLKTRLSRIETRRRSIDSNQRIRILRDMNREKSDISHGCQLGQVMDLCKVYIDGELSFQETSIKCLEIITSKK